MNLCHLWITYSPVEMCISSIEVYMPIIKVHIINGVMDREKNVMEFRTGGDDTGGK